ncbi:copper-transporting ATPase PAA1, chloroplastic-like isoform X2 [Papaver somniferum]|uniref:copper-transporting ATPase PAA1, chloroplastic-like isoform X2 n=1 Tax=Papaver somniferum TaxID=3469 RepID=UPI000E6FDFDB|nr:copper-transporting ATPase PAA1, chloroplastic-like isoform X2 [Papaver somniferum]
MAFTLSAASTLTSKTLICPPKISISSRHINSFKISLNNSTINNISTRFIPISASSRFPHFSCSASGDNASNGGETKGIPSLSSDSLTLDVKGMMCDGCAGSVKKILESQPQVSTATVNLAMETATVLPVDEAKAAQDWQQQLGETLAKHLTNCGFDSTLKVTGQ